MSLPLLAHLADLASTVTAAGELLLFLDFDGTLAPIVAHAGAAQLPPESRDLLACFAARLDTTVSVVSGRSLSDLRRQVGIENLIYSGNHGLEISGPALHFVEPVAAQLVQPLDRLSRDLRQLLWHIPGAWVENKRLTASVHYRQSPAACAGEIRRIVDGALAPLGDCFRVVTGFEVFDIRPNVEWNKGMAIRWIRQATDRQSALPVYVGDDATDEDAFSELPSGITVRIGFVDQTAARFHLAGQAEVVEFLLWLAARKASPSTRVLCENGA